MDLAGIECAADALCIVAKVGEVSLVAVGWRFCSDAV